MTRRAPLHGLLIFLLLFAQEIAVVHLTRHAAEQSGDPQTTAHTDTFCPKCSLYAQFGSSPPSSPLFLPLAAEHADHVGTTLIPAQSRTHTPYRSRAPPTLL